MNKNIIEWEVGGGGNEPIWNFKGWWTGARITVFSVKVNENGGWLAYNKVFCNFYFPEGSVVDLVAQLIAYLISKYFKIFPNKDLQS